MNQGYGQSSGNLVSFSGQVVGPIHVRLCEHRDVRHQRLGRCGADGSGSRGIRCGHVQAGFLRDASQPDLRLDRPCLDRRPATDAIVGAELRRGRAVQLRTLGHNLQFHHATTPSDGYGDASDPMGGAQLVQSNAANRVMAGWLAGSQVRDVTFAGSYAIDAVESATSANPRVLRVAKPDTAELPSARQPNDIDAALNASYLNTLSYVEQSLIDRHPARQDLSARESRRRRSRPRPATPAG